MELINYGKKDVTRVNFESRKGIGTDVPANTEWKCVRVPCSFLDKYTVGLINED